MSISTSEREARDRSKAEKAEGYRRAAEAHQSVIAEAAERHRVARHIHACSACGRGFIVEEFEALAIRSESDGWIVRECSCGAPWPHGMAVRKPGPGAGA